MRKINKKGFTLIELMAVVIILIIIIFIAINKIGDSIDKTENNTYIANAGTYIKAVNALVQEKSLTDVNYASGTFTVAEIEEAGINLSGTKPTDGKLIISHSEVYYACIKYDDIYLKYENKQVNDPSSENCIDNFLTISKDFSYTGAPQTYAVPLEGIYTLEVWGAQGGYRSSSDYGGKGGYSRGNIELNSGDVVYIYVGGSGNTGGTAGGYNGGGSKTTYPGGGGATDMRIEGDTLYHRIIVAGGGGSDGAASYPGKAGGGENGITATETSYCSGGEGGTQTTAGTRGSFGLGGSGAFNNNGWGGGGFGGAGGGGWYGGGGVNPDRSDDDRGGGGGSGFVYTEDSDVSNIDYQVKNHILTDAITIDGTSSEIPTHDGTSTMTGNTGNGYAKITYVGSV